MSGCTTREIRNSLLICFIGVSVLMLSKYLLKKIYILFLKLTIETLLITPSFGAFYLLQSIECEETFSRGYRGINKHCPWNVQQRKGACSFPRGVWLQWSGILSYMKFTSWIFPSLGCRLNGHLDWHKMSLFKMETLKKKKKH